MVFYRIHAAPGTSLLVPRLSVGKVGIEGEMLDSVSGDRLVVFVTSKGGRRWFGGFNAFKKWGNIEAAFRSWGEEFRTRLDEAHGASQFEVALARVNSCNEELIASSPSFAT
jgi:hypothetical protein